MVGRVGRIKDLRNVVFWRFYDETGKKGYIGGHCYRSC